MSSNKPHGDSCEECKYLEELLRKYRLKKEKLKTCHYCGEIFCHRRIRNAHVYSVHFPELARFGFENF
jgi:hypothetical protein